MCSSSSSLGCNARTSGYDIVHSIVFTAMKTVKRKIQVISTIAVSTCLLCILILYATAS